MEIPPVRFELIFELSTLDYLLVDLKNVPSRLFLGNKLAEDLQNH